MSETATDSLADELASLLRAEADWMDHRAGALTRLAAGMVADPDRRQAIRDEAARWRARAMLVRMAVAKAQGV